MSEITLTIQLFGAFREYGDVVDLKVPAGSDLQDLKKALVNKLGEGQAALIQDSALATQTTVLTTNTNLTKDTTLAILPPVCGG